MVIVAIVIVVVISVLVCGVAVVIVVGVDVESEAWCMVRSARHVDGYVGVQMVVGKWGEVLHEDLGAVN